jgi:hypothetical protein
VEEKTFGEKEAEHFRKLDIERLKLEAAHQVVETKAKWEAETQRRKTEYFVAQAREQARKFWRYVFTWFAAVGVVLGIVWGSIALFHHPPRTAEEMKIHNKQQRAEECWKDTSNLSGEHRSVWWPDAANGEGVCLPKGQTPEK